MLALDSWFHFCLHHWITLLLSENFEIFVCLCSQYFHIQFILMRLVFRVGTLESLYHLHNWVFVMILIIIFNYLTPRILFCWEIMLCQRVTGFQHLKATYCPHLQGLKWTFWTLTMREVCCLETLGSDYPFMQHYVPEQEKCRLHCCRNQLAMLNSTSNTAHGFVKENISGRL
jgi:hypothetical protein